MFAMEDRQKENALAYLKEFVKKTGTTIYCSMHELDLSKKYADYVLLFYPGREMAFGTFGRGTLNSNHFSTGTFKFSPCIQL